MKNIRKYLSTGVLLVAATISGCKGDNSRSVLEIDMPEANGYDVVVEYLDKDKSNMSIRIGTYGPEGHFEGEMIYAEDVDGDGRVDNLHLRVGKGSPLEKLASVEKAGEILKAVKEKNNMTP